MTLSVFPKGEIQYAQGKYKAAFDGSSGFTIAFIGLIAIFYDLKIPH